MDDRISQDKKALRSHFLSLRSSLSVTERAESSALIAGRIAGLEEFQGASTVMLYRAVPGEADLHPLETHPASAGKRFVYPVCVSRTEMKAMLPRGWRKGAFGIQEPDPACSEEIMPEEIDLVVCPGVAFDSRKTRLGMGGGYYDRFLPLCRNALIVLAAFEIQRAGLLPREETDSPMDRIVTEAAVL